MYIPRAFIMFGVECLQLVCRETYVYKDISLCVQICVCSMHVDVEHVHI